MQVNITKRIDTPEGKRYCPVVVGPNGRKTSDLESFCNVDAYLFYSLERYGQHNVPNCPILTNNGQHIAYYAKRMSELQYRMGLRGRSHG